MGKPEFKSPRSKPKTTRTRPLTATRSSPIRPSANIKVVVRVRPPNDRERDKNSKVVIDFIDDQVMIFDPKVQGSGFFYHGEEQKFRDLLHKANKNIQFMFDRVFGFESTNDEIFENTTKDLIGSLMEGYNCSVFAYGATGSGKTHTMIGQNDNPGITYLTMEKLFDAKQELEDERNFDLRVSYIEVYNEMVQDLLNPGAPLQLREDSRYGVMVAGIKIQKIDNPNELFSLLAKGNGNRTQHPTDANAESSRSHAVFQVYVRMEFKSTREVRVAKLSMIDLAGSERGSATGYGGARFAEGANINKSLLALGNCINSLADGQKYVPYRDSKLTRLLKDSLGGNCQTVMVANVSPSSLSYEDTYNTLKYATRAKKITSEMKRNVINTKLHVGEYVKIVEDLKKELENAKAQLKQKNTAAAAATTTDPKVTAEFQKIYEDCVKILESIYPQEMMMLTYLAKSKVKKDGRTRLMNLFLGDFTEAEILRRYGNTAGGVNYRQGQDIAIDIYEARENLEELKTKMKLLVNDHPELQKQLELAEAKLGSITAKNQVSVERKKVELLEMDMKTTSDQLDKSLQMLRSCYSQLRGRGLAADKLIAEYEDLMKEIHGKKSVTWDSPIDSGLSATSSAASIDPEERSPTKRANDENVDYLNSTYVMGAPSKPKVKLCAEELLAKVYDSQSPNRIKTRREVEHKGILTRTPVFSPRPWRTNKSVQKKKPETAKKRPPFRT